jgi:hypothetical protein
MYGYDFYFYAEIDDETVVSEVNKKIEIRCKKKVKGVWPRLLSSMSKVFFFDFTTKASFVLVLISTVYFEIKAKLHQIELQQYE